MVARNALVISVRFPRLTSTLTIQPGVTPSLSGDGATASLGFEF
jgi:hypothetical protein